MPLPRIVVRINKRYTNRFIEPIVRRSPGFAVVGHTGRQSGRPYTTPVYAFDAGDAVVVSLTYGPSADWVRNVFANGGSLRRNGSEFPIVSPTIVGRERAWPHLPRVVRLWLRILRVTDFMLIPVR